MREWITTPETAGNIGILLSFAALLVAVGVHNARESFKERRTASALTLKNTKGRRDGIKTERSHKKLRAWQRERGFIS